MKAGKTLISLISACVIAGCAVGSRTLYDGKICDKKVKYEKVYTASLGYEPDYKMTVNFPDSEEWVMIDNNMDNMMKPGDDVVRITKDGDTKTYRGITPMTLPIMQEADELYQSLLKEVEKEIEKKKREPISNKGLNY